MNFRRKFGIATLLALTSLSLFICCEEDLTTLGDGVIADEPFTSGQANFDVFARNQRLLAVQTNRLPLYQLGFFNDPIYGRREARITSQLQLSAPNPIFGNFSQSTEDVAETDDLEETINEEETVTEVILYIPYQLASPEFRDQDNDGVPGINDVDDNDSESDSDRDGISDIDETRQGSDPLDNRSPDTDGNGTVSDAEQEDVEANPNQFPQSFALDSIFFNNSNVLFEDAPFRLKVEESTFFLSDLNPETNFEQAQEYFSNNEDLTTSFVGQRLDNMDANTVTVSSLEFFEQTEDDVNTEENEFNIERQNPGIRIPLKTEFFQNNILNKEGSSELLTQSNFSNFLRGIHLSLEVINEDILLLLDLTQATITVNYTFLDVPSTTDTDDNTSTVPEEAEGSYVINLVQGLGGAIQGNAVNTILNPNFPTDIDFTAENAERIYLKGGPGSVAEIRLFDEDGAESIIEEIRSNNWVINEANLEFYVDRETLDMASSSEVEFFEPPRLYLFNAETNAPIYNPFTETNSAETPLGAFLSYDGILMEEKQKGIKYTVRITEYLNNIVVRDSSNVPLKLSLSSDIRVTAVQEAMSEDAGSEIEVPIMSTINPFGTVLFGGNVSPENEDKKLRLRVFYTEAN